MTIQKYSSFRKYLFIFSVLFLFSGCDIIDAIIGDGTDDSNNQQNNDGKTILRVEVHLFIEDCTFIWTYSDRSPITAAHTSYGASITSVSGTSTYTPDNINADVTGWYDTTFDRSFLGTTYSGTMEIIFFQGNTSIALEVDQTRKFGGTTKHITVSHPGVLHSASSDSTDSYRIENTHFATSYTDSSGTWATTGSIKTLQPGYVCGPNSYLSVLIFYH